MHHQRLMAEVQAAFQWGTWETNRFIQCGVDVHQQEDYRIELRQENFIDDLHEIFLSRDRSQMTECPTTQDEKSKLKGVLGSLCWIVGQTCFLYAVDVNMLLTKIPSSTVQDILTANKVTRDMKKIKHQASTIHTFDPEDTLELTAWSDAARANRPNGVDSACMGNVRGCVKCQTKGRKRS